MDLSGAHAEMAARCHRDEEAAAIFAAYSLVIDGTLGPPSPGPCGTLRPACLALVAEGLWSIAVDDHGNGLLATILAAAEPNAFMYTPGHNGRNGRLHHTLLQLISMRHYDAMPPEDVEAVTDAAVAALPAWRAAFAPPWTVVFDRLCLTPSGLVALGAPDRAYNTLRDFVRSSGLVKHEYHPQNICHCTLFRWHSRPSIAAFQNLQRLVNQWNAQKTIACVFTATDVAVYKGTWEMTAVSGATRIA